MDRLKASHDFRDCDNNLGTCEVIFTDYSHETNRAIVDYGVSIRKPLNWGLININITRNDFKISEREISLKSFKFYFRRK
jgi:hypothetical protein